MPDFDAFASNLKRAGVAPQHVRRSVEEMRDHYLDLVDDRLDAGYSQQAAEAYAERALGELDTIALEVVSRPELRSWAYRWPRAALVVYPLACAAMLPAVPVLGVVNNASTLRRWAACLLAGATVTATMFLVLQLAITLT